jgi:chromosome segregation ATPase
MKLNDLPEADKIARVAIAMLPPEVQKAYHEEDTADMPPAAKAEIQQQGQQIEQMAQAMDQAGKVIQDLQSQLDEKNDVVKAEADKAMAEIKAAQAGLKAQSDNIKAQERELADAKRIAMLELQLQDAKTANEQQTQETQEKEAADNSENELLTALAETLKQGQEAMIQALEQNAKMNVQTQSLVVDAIEDMADAMSAPRKIQLQKGADGRTTGATSVAVMGNDE